METISITRALGQLKLLDKRISKAITAGNFANYTVGGKSYLDKFTPEADLQSVQDLINYRAKLKASIMVSNSTTDITIGETTMTVVEAIESKESIKYRKDLLRKMKSDVSNVESTVLMSNEQVQERLDRMLEASFGRDSKPTGTEFETVGKPFLDKNEFVSVDNVKIQETITKLENEIDTFEAEVDLVLSESNATTNITL